MREAAGTALTRLNPSTLAPPAGRYSHGVLVPAGAKLLFISGQVGIEPDGSVPDDFVGQARSAWRNLLAILDDAGMGPANLVKVTHYLTRPSDLPAYREVRASMAGQALPASVLVFVSALADPRWVVEVEAIAAQP
jgi:enamine deaminase RidA (YjgF/YER057c/UK114 family)